MHTATDLSFSSLPKTYDELVRFHMPRPIHDDVEYDNVAEIVDVLAVAGDELNADQRDYLELLTKLIETHDAENITPPRKMSAVQTLQFLLDENGLTGDDLAKLLGIDRSTAYKILRGRRKLTMSHVAQLTRRFRVSADVFVG